MRVQIATLGWGLILDKHGNGRQGVTVKLQNLDATDATVYSAATGGTTLTTTGDLTTGAKGSLPGFMEVETYLLTIDGVTYQVEAVSGRTAGAATPLDDSVTLAKLNAAVKPTGTAAPGDLAVRKLGTGASDAAAGNDARLSDQRTPTDGSVTAAKVAGSLKPSGSAAAGDEALRALGSGGTQAAAGNDARFPSTGQKNALVGTDGTPGTGNEYVTKSDASVTNQRTPTDDSVTPTKLKGSPAPSSGQGLVWNGSAFVPANLVTDPGGADGDILIRSGSGATFAALAKGTSGQFLMVRSDGTLKWTTPTPVHMTAWGVVGGGVDDTTAAQNALNAAGGAPVTLPPFAMRITTALTGNTDNFTLTGFGAASQIVLDAGANTNVIRLNTTANTSGAGTTRVKRVLLRDFYIDMNGAGQGNVAGGIDGCIAAPGIDYFQADNVYVKNSKNTAFELRGSSVVRCNDCTVDGVYSGNNGNGYNVGKTGDVVGTDAVFSRCLAIGVQDVAFWLGGDGAHRMTADACTVRSDARRYFADGAITNGSGVLTSATAAFTTKDLNKSITVAGAGVAGAALTCRIRSFTNATTVGLSVAASTTVSGAVFSYGADNAPARRVIDAAMTSGSNQLTSATAAFTSADIQKGFFIVGAGASGANVIGKITAVTNATTATVDFNAGTTVSGAVALVNCTSSGIVSEGSAGNSDHLSINASHVIGTVRVGMGGTDASAGTVGSKHDQLDIVAGSVAESYGTAVWCTGTQHSIAALKIDNYHENGILLGDGNDFDEREYTLSGGSVKAAADATGNALTVRKDGSNTNWLSGVSVTGTQFYGNGGGARGISVEGKVRGTRLIGVGVSGFKKSGIVLIAKGGASPVDTEIIGHDVRNNNQGGNAAGVDSVGIACESAADTITIALGRITDDQASKTQTHAIHWLGATRGRIKGNDLRGNLTGPYSQAFDSKTIVEDNITADADYEGEATLVGGTVTVSTAAVINTPASVIELSHKTIGGTPGALYVSTRTNNTSFVISSTSGTDTSTVKWRIR